MCWVNNTVGEETIQVTLTVTGKKQIENRNSVHNNFHFHSLSPFRGRSSTDGALAATSANRWRWEGCTIPMHCVRTSCERHTVAARWKANNYRQSNRGKPFLSSGDGKWKRVIACDAKSLWQSNLEFIFVFCVFRSRFFSISQTFNDPPRLLIRKIQKEDQGMYQCFATNEWEQIQSTAELQLGGKFNLIKLISLSGAKV